MLVPNTILQSRYKVIRHLSSGGMGAVYLAEDMRFTDLMVILKENRTGDEALFFSEANLLAKLRHPCLPRVTDHFIQNRSQFLVMDYIRGQTLMSILKLRGPLSEKEALQLLYGVFEAVTYLHGNNILHRDIKPDNIIITPDNNSFLVDLGIAKVIGKNSVRAATPGFAPPEQYTGGTTKQSDIYALGATLYCTLTNRVPTDSLEQYIDKKPLPLPHRINPAITSKIEANILKAMHLDLKSRYSTIDEMIKQFYISYSYQSTQVITSEGLEKTMANPHYQSDLRLEANDYNLSTVLNEKTIFIITGCYVVSELIDRPIAEWLRDEIDRRGNVSIGHRAIVIGDMWWFQDQNFSHHPVIAIGGPAANSLTNSIIPQGQVWNYADGVFGLQITHPFLRTALWGYTSLQTRLSVQYFIQHTEGLQSFLKRCWG